MASAQNTFVVAAKENDRTLIAVLLKTKERTDLWKDAIKLFDAAFNQPKVERTFVRAGPQSAVVEEKSFEVPLTTYLAEDIRLSYYPAEEPRVKGLIFWDSLTLPIAKGEKVGEFRLVGENNEALVSAPLYAGNLVKGTWSHRLTSFFTTGSLPSRVFKGLLVLFTLGGLFMLILGKKGR